MSRAKATKRSISAGVMVLRSPHSPPGQRMRVRPAARVSSSRSKGTALHGPKLVPKSSGLMGPARTVASTAIVPGSAAAQVAGSLRGAGGSVAATAALPVGALSTGALAVVASAGASSTAGAEAQAANNSMNSVTGKMNHWRWRGDMVIS